MHAQTQCVVRMETWVTSRPTCSREVVNATCSRHDSRHILGWNHVHRHETISWGWRRNPHLSPLLLLRWPENTEQHCSASFLLLFDDKTSIICDQQQTVRTGIIEAVAVQASTFQVTLSLDRLPSLEYYKPTCFHGEETCMEIILPLVVLKGGWKLWEYRL